MYKRIPKPPRVYPKLVANDLVGVQPMFIPSDIVYLMKEIQCDVQKNPSSNND